MNKYWIIGNIINFIVQMGNIIFLLEAYPEVSITISFISLLFSLATGAGAGAGAGAVAAVAATGAAVAVAVAVAVGEEKKE